MEEEGKYTVVMCTVMKWYVSEIRGECGAGSEDSSVGVLKREPRRLGSPVVARICAAPDL